MNIFFLGGSSGADADESDAAAAAAEGADGAAAVTRFDSSCRSNSKANAAP
jgi:hypothetical protein